jgi:hypothetical protein
MKKAAPVKRVLLSERREDAERELIANVIAYKPTRAEMDELLSI